MSRFESPYQVLLLFVGAAMVSVVLIMLLDAEARSRKMHKDPVIENGNLFSALGHKVARLVTRWGASNSTNDIIVVTETDYSRSKRSLQSVGEDDDTTDPPQHKVRHSKSRRKPSSPAREPPTPTPSRPLGPHDACYSTNEVLLIIAITCAVNFAFIFVIMTLVHVCNRNNKVAMVSGLDSLLIADNGDCTSQTERGSQKLTLVLTSDQSVTKLCESTSYNSVQDYVNSLPAMMNDRDFAGNRTPSMVSLHTLGPCRNNVPDRKCQQDTNKRKSSYNMQTAFSMEDLLFVD